MSKVTRTDKTDPLKIDPQRDAEDPTGIYVRAQHPDGKWDSVDLSNLTRQSVVDWLEDKAVANPAYPIQVVLALLDHQP